MPHGSDRLSEKEARRRAFLPNQGDRTILLALLATRVISTAQVVTLLAVTQPAAHKRLTRLYGHRYLDRQDWDRRHVYSLDTLGIEYLAEVTGGDGDALRRYRAHDVSRFFLDHAVAVGDVYVALTLAARARGLTLAWRNEIGAADHYIPPSGEEHKLEPDAVFTLTGPGIPATLAFLEVDRATESWQKWAQKVQDYNAYFLAGRFARTWPAAERVLLLATAPDGRRIESLREFIARRWQARLRNVPVPVGLTVQEAIRGDPLTIPWVGLDGRSFCLAG